MTRFAGRRLSIACAQNAQEAAGDRRVIRERRRKLDEQNATLVPERRGFVEEPFERFGDLGQPAVVRDRLRNLDRETESRRDTGRPTFVRCGTVRTIERRIDLDARKPGGIAFERAALDRKIGANCGGDRPPAVPTRARSASPIAA